MQMVAIVFRPTFCSAWAKNISLVIDRTVYKASVAIHELRGARKSVGQQEQHSEVGCVVGAARAIANELSRQSKWKACVHEQEDYAHAS